MRPYDEQRPTTVVVGEVTSDDPDTEEIRIEIEQTRTELSTTIDAIQDRLAPEVLSAQAKDVAHDVTAQAQEAATNILEKAVHDVKEAAKEMTAHAVTEVKDAAREMTGNAKDAAWDATVGRVEAVGESASHAAKGLGGTVIDTIKQHPVPAAIAGISLAWLLMNRSSNKDTNFSSNYPRPAGAPLAGAYGSHARYGSQTYYMTENDPTRTSSTPGIGERVSGAASQAAEMAGNAAGGAREMASDLASSASDVASSVASGASSAASSAGHAASVAGDRAMDAGSSLLDMIKRNPIPAGMVGAGLVWLAMNSSGNQSSDASRMSGAYSQARRERMSPFETSSDWGATKRSRQPQTAQQEQGGMLHSATEQASEYAGKLQERASDLTEQAGEYASSAWDSTRHAPGQIHRMVEDNPLMTAALAATLGAAVGLMLPNTQREDQLLGQTRDSIMGQAREMGRDAMDKVQSIASEAQDSATREARVQGLQV